MDDAYLTIRQASKTEIKVKGSRFIGEACLAETVEQAIAQLGAIRKREYNATHHCYAYIIGRGPQPVFKYSDDGEPGGTAGKPIYDVVAGSGATNVLCVVTRYFGGTKLGAGGLVRAYGAAASAALAAAGTIERYDTVEFRLGLEFSLYDRWQLQLQAIGAEVVQAKFTDSVSLHVKIRAGRAERLEKMFTELTSGRGRIEKIQHSADS
jgi:uncharacterized YigZ family protein